MPATVLPPLENRLKEPQKRAKVAVRERLGRLRQFGPCHYLVNKTLFLGSI